MNIVKSIKTKIFGNIIKNQKSKAPDMISKSIINLYSDYNEN